MKDFNETNLKSILFSYFKLNNEYYTVKSEYETDRSYIDLTLISNDININSNNFALELKYLKKKNKSDLIVTIDKIIEK